jgi:hypothetical protein
MPITKASEWRNKTLKPIELELPSGLTVLVRKPPLHLWIARGKLPENIVQASLNIQPGQTSPPPLSNDQLRSLFKFVREVVTTTVVEPRIVENPTSDDEISPDDVPLDDANFIFAWAMAGGATPPEQKIENQDGSVAQVDVTDLRAFRSF